MVTESNHTWSKIKTMRIMGERLKILELVYYSVFFDKNKHIYTVLKEFEKYFL